MSYKALYRKWRPEVFEEVMGQEHIVRTLKNQIAADSVSHAYLFSGIRGTGKNLHSQNICQSHQLPKPTGWKSLQCM